jgi:hypothetical protein
MWGTETILCLGLLMLGSLGLFIMFWVTDSDAIDESRREARKSKGS